MHCDSKIKYLNFVCKALFIGENFHFLHMYKHVTD